MTNQCQYDDNQCVMHTKLLIDKNCRKRNLSENFQLTIRDMTIDRIYDYFER